MERYNLKLTRWQKIAAFFSKKKRDKYEQIGLLRYCLNLMNKSYRNLVYIILQVDQNYNSCWICDDIERKIYHKSLLTINAVPKLPKINQPHINCRCSYEPQKC